MTWFYAFSGYFPRGVYCVCSSSWDLWPRGSPRNSLIQRLHRRVVVRFADGHPLVRGVGGRDALVADFLVGGDGLAAAADAAARAAHDLHEVVVGLAGLDLVQHLAGVAQAVGHRHLDLGPAHVDRGFLDASRPRTAVKLTSFSSSLVTSV